MHRLVFHNPSAFPKNIVVECSIDSVPRIMAWYGAYCAGDRYTVSLDGRHVPMDRNGEPETEAAVSRAYAALANKENDDD